MNSLAIVHELHKYFLLLTAIEEREKEIIRENTPAPKFNKSVSLRYDWLTLTIKYNNGEMDFYSAYFEATFNISGQTVKFTELHYVPDQAKRKNEILDFLLRHVPKSFDNAMLPNSESLNKETVQYLSIADEIAKQAYLCSSGDDYRPGYFSEISMDDTGIMLNQINHWNSRSIAHKQDYHLRNLEFQISNEIRGEKLPYGADQIGRMMIVFSDRSSNNNKSCGDKIYNEIQIQKAQFERKSN